MIFARALCLPLCLSLCLAQAVQAQGTDPAAAARAAADRLERASVGLDAAEGARDRVKALTETVRGYEAGLAAMRVGLRRASIREQQLARELEARDGEVAQLLGVLQGIGRSRGPQILLHPGGPTATARAGMLLADVTPALQARADTLRADLDEASTLRALQQDAAERLQEGLRGVQQARTALSQAIADRTDLPQRFVEDPIQTAVLIAATETLEGFASGLSDMDGPDTAPVLDIGAAKGNLPLPVQGRILHAPGEADAAGIARPGIVVATRPRALVTTPAAATIRYRGPLLDYGQVTILEPQKDTLFVLAGLDVTFGETGQVLPEGSPVGLMGGDDPQIGAIVSTSGDGAGNAASETLYIEVRQGREPVNPLEWFRTDKD